MFLTKSILVFPIPIAFPRCCKQANGARTSNYTSKEKKDLHFPNHLMGHHLRDRTWGSYKWSKKKKGFIFSRIERVRKSLLPNWCLLLQFCRLFRAYFHLCHFVVFSFRYICFFYDSCQRIIWPLQIKLSWFFLFCVQITAFNPEHKCTDNDGKFSQSPRKNKTEKKQHNLQDKSNCHSPTSHGFFQPLSGVALFQQCRQNNLKEKQLQRQFTNWDLTACAKYKYNRSAI